MALGGAFACADLAITGLAGTGAVIAASGFRGRNCAGGVPYAMRHVCAPGDALCAKWRGPRGVSGRR